MEYNPFKRIPQETDEKTEALINCVELCIQCADQCYECAEQCLQVEDVYDLVSCIRLCGDCAETTEMTAGQLAQKPELNDPGLRGQVEKCLHISRACANEAAKFGSMYQFCRECAALCRQCEDACYELLKKFSVPHESSEQSSRFTL